MGKKIIVTIPLEGDIKIEAQGYTGSSCKDATKFLEAMGEKTSDKNTAEFYTNSTTQQKQQNKA